MAKNKLEQIPQKGTLTIKVDAAVVKHLSIGLYRNYALAIKELISNAYDAGATEVKIKLDLKKKRIIIRDNGRGMDYDDFDKEYLCIGLHKVPSRKPDELGRLRIGTFGIGFLAPLPYCKRMVVITKKRGSDKVFQATIKAINFFSKGNWDIKNEKVDYEITDSDLPRKSGETIVILEDVEPQIAEDLNRSQKSAKAKLDQLGGFDKFKWTLSQYCPIDFPSEWKTLRKFFKYPGRIPMRIWLDGKELFRNVPKGCEILEKDEKVFGNIHVKYAILTPYHTVKPEEARGLQLRLRDVAIGFPQDFDVTKLGRVLGKLNQLCGEVHILKGLDNALMITRDSFNYTEEVAELYKFFRDMLTKWNNWLADEADATKKVYEVLPQDKADAIAETLREADVVKFPKKRFRLSKSLISSRRKGEISKPSSQLKEALKSRRGFSVVSSKAERTKDEPAVEVDKERKSIIVYDEHPSFLDSIEVEKKKILVSYDKWEVSETPYSICKYNKRHNKAVFNTNHPLFKSKVSDKVVKQLSLGILILLQGTKEKERIVSRFNRLLEDVFQG
jgi:hypothetical protein